MSIKNEITFLNSLLRSKRSLRNIRRKRLNYLQLKECSSCLTIKSITLFPNKSTKRQCKQCLNNADLKYRKRTANKKQENWKKYSELNSEKIRKKNLLYNQTQNKKLSNHKYQTSEKGRKNRREYNKHRKKIDPIFSLKQRIRSRLYCFLHKTNKFKKSKQLVKYIGCTETELQTHFEKLFKTGMTWENKYLWHIDHIIPLSSAKTEEEVFKLCHYTNLQPLWAKDNLMKSNKMPHT